AVVTGHGIRRRHGDAIGVAVDGVAGDEIIAGVGDRDSRLAVLVDGIGRYGVVVARQVESSRLALAAAPRDAEYGVAGERRMVVAAVEVDAVGIIARDRAVDDGQARGARAIRCKDAIVAVGDLQ